MSNSNESFTRRNLLERALGTAALAAALGSENRSHAQETEPPPRIRDSFDFGWKFTRGDSAGAQHPAFVDAGWRELDLPHDWSIEGPFSPDEPSGGPGANAPTGIGWYRKRFHVPPSYQGRRVSVEFDGVYQNSEVWVNGHYLGKRPFGYISFAYDITPYLSWNGENIAAVKVDNSRQPSSRWYSGSGIYRHTWLVAVNPTHVAHLGTFVTTLRVSQESALVYAKTRVRNDSGASTACTLASAILDRDGKVVAAAEASQEIAPGDDYEFAQELSVGQPNLWSVSAPNLYRLRSTVRVGPRVLDEYETPFGIREALFDADKGFLLNGERVKLNGVCLHHEAASVGAAVPERVWERRFEILKQMGCNAIRTSHNPPAPEFLDLCDRMGFLVMNEALDEWKFSKPQVRGNGYSLHYDEWHERDVTDFVHRDRNHPSVVLWSCGNEIGDQLTPRGVELLRDLLNIFHREDPTRFVTAGCDDIVAEPKGTPVEFLGLLDVVGYNYVDRWRERRELYYSLDKAAHPNWRMIGTESSGMGGPRGDYRGMMPPAPGQAAAPPPAPGGGRRAGFGLDTEQLWKFVRTHDYVAGDFMWTGIDYIGESGWPNRGNTSGCIDSCGFPKDGYYFYQSQWTTAPMLHLFPHWNWKGREGQFLTVACYTNCDQVELFLNGRSVGTKGFAFPRFGQGRATPSWQPQAANSVRTTSDLHLAWDVPYEPGTLRAVGTKGGHTAVEVEIATTGDPSAIQLSADRDTIRADRRDVAHITAKVVDTQGRMHPEADNDIAFAIDGPAKLVGVDNGDMSNQQDFKGKQKKAFHGMCLAIVQSTANAGPVRVTVTSPGLPPTTLTITTKS
jgi:beta-galactosidase